MLVTGLPGPTCEELNLSFISTASPIHSSHQPCRSPGLWHEGLHRTNSILLEKSDVCRDFVTPGGMHTDKTVGCAPLVSLLVALLISVAQQSVCRSNLRQMVLPTHNYYGVSRASATHSGTAGDCHQAILLESCPLILLSAGWQNFFTQSNVEVLL